MSQWYRVYNPDDPETEYYRSHGIDNSLMIEPPATLEPRWLSEGHTSPMSFASTGASGLDTAYDARPGTYLNLPAITGRDLDATAPGPSSWAPSYTNPFHPSAQTVNDNQRMLDIERSYFQDPSHSGHSQPILSSRSRSSQQQPPSTSPSQKPVTDLVQLGTASTAPSSDPPLIVNGPSYHVETSVVHFDFTYAIAREDGILKCVNETKRLAEEVLTFGTTWGHALSGETSVTESFAGFCESLVHDDQYRRFLSREICSEFDSYLVAIVALAKVLETMTIPADFVENGRMKDTLKMLMQNFRALEQRIVMVNAAFEHKKIPKAKMGKWRILKPVR